MARPRSVLASASLAAVLCARGLSWGATPPDDLFAPAPAAPTTPATAAPAPPAAPANPADPSPAPVDPARQREDLLLDQGLQALLAGDLNGAEIAFDHAATWAATAEGRAAAEKLGERVRALRYRRASLALPPVAVRAEEAPPTRKRRDDSARPTFLATTTLLGLGVWGWSLPLAFKVTPDEYPRGFLGLYMLSAASGFLVPYLITGNETPPTWAQTDLAFYGGTRGMEYGVLVSNLFLGADGGNLSDSDGANHALATGIFLGSAGSLAGGYLWAGAAQMTPGQARTIALLGDCGLFFGFGLGHLLNLDQNDKPFEERDRDAQARGMAAAGLTGTLFGLAGGRLLGNRRQSTWGDGEVTRAAGVLGVWTGASLAVLLELEGSKPLLTTLMLGGALGVGVGDYLVRSTRFGVGASITVDLATIAGGLGGAGLTYLLTRSDSPKPYFAASTLGAGLAFALTYRAYAQETAADRRADARTMPRLGLAPQLDRGGLRGVGVMGTF